jgi:hypothetical protein
MIVSVPLLLLWLAMVAVLQSLCVLSEYESPFLGFRKDKDTSQRLTFSQHTWVIGVLILGCGMWIVTTLDDYLDWKYWNGPAHDLFAGRLLFHAVLWPLGRLLFGWMLWNGRTN